MKYLLPANILFILLLIILAWFNRLAVDDFYAIGLINEFGVQGAIENFYTFSNGRWFGVSVMVSSIYAIYHGLVTVFIYQLITFSCFIIAIYFLFKQLTRLFNLSVSGFESVSLTVSFFIFYFLISPEKGETFFWVTSTSQYLWSMTFMILGFAVLVKNKPNMNFYFLLGLTFSLIGGGPESLTFGCLIVLTTLLILEKKFTSFSPLINYDVLKKQVFVSVTFLMLSFSFNFLSPGSNERKTWLPEPDIFKAFYENFKGLGKVGIYESPLIIFYSVLFCIPWILIGGRVSVNTNTSSKVVLRNIFRSGLIMLAVFFIILLPGSYVLSEPPPKRAWMQIYFAVTVFICYCSFKAGTVIKISARRIKTMKLIFIAGSSALLISIILYQLKTVRTYSREYDARLEIVIKGKSSTLILEPLPRAGMLYSAEITIDTAHFKNKHLQYGIGVKANLKVKE